MALVTRISPSDQAALDDLYRQLKELEGRIPIPESSARVLVGVLNARTGVFSWRIREKRLTKTVPGQGTIVVITGQASVNAVNVSLVFGVQDRQGDFTVTADGTTISAPAGQTEVTVDIRRAPEISFTVNSGNVNFSSSLTIVRFAAGAGAFTIDALPIALVYCPLQGVSRQNLISYQRTEWTGTKIGIIRTQEDSEVQESLTRALARQKLDVVVVDGVASDVTQHVGRPADRRRTGHSAGGHRRLLRPVHRPGRPGHPGQADDGRHPAGRDPDRPRAAPVRHPDHRRGARAQPQHRLHPRLRQAAAPPPPGPQGGHHLRHHRPGALRGSLREGEQPAQREAEQPAQREGEQPAQREGEQPAQRNAEQPVQRRGADRGGLGAHVPGAGAVPAGG